MVSEVQEETMVSTVHGGRKEEADGWCPGLPHRVIRWAIWTYPRPAPDPLRSVPLYPYTVPHIRGRRQPSATPPRKEIPNKGGRVPGKPRDLGEGSTLVPKQPAVIAPQGAIDRSAVLHLSGQLADVALQRNLMPAEPNGRCGAAEDELPRAMGSL